MLWEMVVRLVLAIAAGGLIGLERERHDRPAGLRTHILVCAGSALITLVSMHLGGERSDPTRIAAQIVSGIGFLGAGTIFRYGVGVRGLTTAAGLWVVAGIGMGIAAGGDLMQLALIATVLVFLVNSAIRHLENRVLRRYEAVRVRLARGDESLARLFEGLQSREIRIYETRWLPEEAAAGEAVLHLRMRVPTALDREMLTAWLGDLPGVRDVLWE